jgi:hypothetical protein
VTMSAPGKDAKGRFAPGNAGGPGRPPKARAEDLLQRLRDRLSNGDFDLILSALVKKAQRGDVAATRLLLEYGIGKPSQDVNLAGTLTQIIVRYVDNQDTDDDQPQDAP